MIRIEWDSITLKNMLRVFIENREKDDRLWSEMDLYDNKLLPSRPRDRKKHVVTAIGKISKKYCSDLFSKGDDDDTEIDRVKKTDPVFRQAHTEIGCHGYRYCRCEQTVQA